MAKAGTADVPRIGGGGGGGRNVYDVVGINLTIGTSLEDVTKAYKMKAKELHPDAKGGSTERMSELNGAYKLIKEHHNQVIRNFAEQGRRAAQQQQQQYTSSSTTTSSQQYPDQESSSSSFAGRRGRRGHFGGVSPNQNQHNTNNTQYHQQQQTTQRERPHTPHRTQAEVEAAWSVLRMEASTTIDRIVSRYECALEQAAFHKAAGAMVEIAARERSVRNNYISLLWEKVHELRTDLLRKGSRNLQMSQLAEDMSLFATTAQKKLTQDYERQTQQAMAVSLKINLVKWLQRMRVIGIVGGVAYLGFHYWRNNSYYMKLAPALQN